MLSLSKKNLNEKFPEFDSDFYLENYPDVKALGRDPLIHYLTNGWKENRSPSRYITTLELIATNPYALKALGMFGRRPNIFRKALKRILSQFRKKGVYRTPAAEPSKQPLPTSDSDGGKDVLYVGYIEAMLGLGEASRGLIVAAVDSGVAMRLLPYNYGVENRFLASFMSERYDLSGAHPITILDISVDALPEAIRRLGEARLGKSYTILRAYWELPSAPQEWGPIVAFVDEIWVASEFIRQSLSTVFSGPIVVIPPIVAISAATFFTREHFSLRDNVYYFVFSFDFHSSIARKNPLAVIQAFQAAFDHNYKAVGLIIKCHGVDKKYDEIKAMIAAIIATDNRISLIDAALSRDEFISLLKVSDCYVSLHRAEGFGLGMAEAMLLEKCVIGTNFSGNVDFLSEETGFPINFTLKAVEADEYAHAAGQFWAEPKLDDAAKALRFALEDQAEGLRRALNGRRFIENHYNSQVVGSRIKQRLDRIMAMIMRVQK